MCTSWTNNSIANSLPPLTFTMMQKWCIPAQEEFLEHWYVSYQEMKYDKKPVLFKEFWVSLKTEWYPTVWMGCRECCKGGRST